MGNRRSEMHGGMLPTAVNAPSLGDFIAQSKKQLDAVLLKTDAQAFEKQLFIHQ